MQSNLKLARNHHCSKTKGININRMKRDEISVWICDEQITCA
jgi:hypothetical protein